MKISEQKDIDIVITWVDNKDPKWQKDFAKNYSGKVDFVRYEDTGTLKYIFRGLEKFMPWVRKVHLVTCEHLPEWIDTTYPKINIVKHQDIFSPENLPTFNSSAIEMAFVNIPDLAEQFIYFNDDMLVLKPLNKSRFFYKGLPVDNIVLSSLHYDGIFTHGLHEISSIVQKEMAIMTKLQKLKLCLSTTYSIRRNLRNLMFILGGYHPNFSFYHFPQPHLKSNMISFHKDYTEKANYTLQQKFRSPLNCNQYAFRYLGLVRNKFSPRKELNDTKYIIYDTAKSLKRQIQNNITSDVAFLCFGESNKFKCKEYQDSKKITRHFLDSRLGTKSLYEK